MLRHCTVFRYLFYLSLSRKESMNVLCCNLILIVVVEASRGSLNVVSDAACWCRAKRPKRVCL